LHGKGGSQKKWNHSISFGDSDGSDNKNGDDKVGSDYEQLLNDKENKVEPTPHSRDDNFKEKSAKNFKSKVRASGVQSSFNQATNADSVRNLGHRNAPEPDAGKHKSANENNRSIFSEG